MHYKNFKYSAPKLYSRCNSFEFFALDLFGSFKKSIVYRYQFYFWKIRKIIINHMNIKHKINAFLKFLLSLSEKENIHNLFYTAIVSK